VHRQSRGTGGERARRSLDMKSGSLTSWKAIRKPRRHSPPTASRSTDAQSGQGRTQHRSRLALECVWQGPGAGLPSQLSVLFAVRQTYDDRCPEFLSVREAMTRLRKRHAFVHELIEQGALEVREVEGHERITAAGTCQ